MIKAIVITQVGFQGRVRFDSQEIFRHLDRIHDFEHFFIEASKLKVNANSRSDIRMLKKEISKFCPKFSVEAITYLLDSITTEACIPMNNQTERNFTEKEYQEMIVRDFKKIFPDYLFLGREVAVDEVGRIDILAQDKATQRDVIIELKVRNHNPNTQLLAYGSKFDNPILIGITEYPIDEKRKMSNATYYTYKDIGIL